MKTGPGAVSTHKRDRRHTDKTKRAGEGSAPREISKEVLAEPTLPPYRQQAPNPSQMEDSLTQQHQQILAGCIYENSCSYDQHQESAPARYSTTKCRYVTRGVWKLLVTVYICTSKSTHNLCTNQTLAVWGVETKTRIKLGTCAHHHN